MIINPNLLKMFEEEKKLIGGTQFSREFEALSETDMVEGLVRNVKHYENDSKKLRFLLAVAVLFGVRVGRRWDPDDKILVEGEP